jgi:hypothetical protein
VQPVFLVQVLEFSQPIAGADSTRAIPAYVGVEVIGDAHAFQVFRVIDVEGVEDESPDQIERESLGRTFCKICTRRCRYPFLNSKSVEYKCEALQSARPEFDFVDNSDDD